MSRTIVSTEDLPKAPPFYSHAVKCAGLVFVSGTAAYDATTGMIVGETIQEQTAQALRNIAAILKAAGTTLDKAVSAIAAAAPPGDVVLLAPACSSFDQFESYEHRGRVFKELVNEWRGWKVWQNA